MRKIIAVSMEEAIGSFIMQMSKELPEHSIHVRPVWIVFEDTPQNNVDDVEQQPTTE